jgi:hypothetical protein
MQSVPFSEYTDFCCLALSGPTLEAAGTHSLMPGLTVSDSVILDLDETWVKWLGSLQADAFRGSSLFILAERQHIFAGGDAGVRQAIERRARLLHNALVLRGCGYNHSMLMVGGSVGGGGSLHIGPITHGLTPSFRPNFRFPRKITFEDLANATEMLISLEHIYHFVPARPYRRLRKGFNLWHQGARETDLNERLHLFLRAVEAVIRPTIAYKRKRKSKRPPWRQVTYTFTKRGERLIGRSKENARLLRELYAIRSSIEHVQDILPKVRRFKSMDAEKTYQFRVLQCEILASAVYSRILTNPQLREQLRSEQGVEGFWNRGPKRFNDLWGEKIDLGAAAWNEFIKPLTW